jgi:type IV pilus assembly protein PilA
MLEKFQTGLTLIELMIVVAIVGILAPFAIPAYQNYLIRAQVMEGLSLADPWKTAIIEYYANTGTWPSQADLPYNSPSAGNYATNLTVSMGVIKITYGGRQANPGINGAILSLVPYTNGDNDVVWQCGFAAAPQGKIAAGALAGGTTLAPELLPNACNS